MLPGCHGKAAFRTYSLPRFKHKVTTTCPPSPDRVRLQCVDRTVRPTG